MPESTSNNQRRRRRWSFADCLFDEGNWTLIVGGRRVPIETKPLELLRALLLRAGNLVTKDELLDSIWPDVTVVEASLPTAVHKLRMALNDERRKTHIIETVPRIGYRLAVPVEVEELVHSDDAGVRNVATPSGFSRPIAAFADRGTWAGSPRLLSISGGLALAAAQKQLAQQFERLGFDRHAFAGDGQRPVRLVEHAVGERPAATTPPVQARRSRIRHAPTPLQKTFRTPS